MRLPTMVLGLVLSLTLTASLVAEEPSSEAIRQAVAKSLPLLERGAKGSREERPGCYTCHNAGMPVVAMTAARSRGFKVDRNELDEQLQFTADFLKTNEKNYLAGKGQGGGVDTASSALMTLDRGGWTPDATTAAVAEYLLLNQKNSDHWKSNSKRPPTQQSEFTTTFAAMRGLKAFVTPAQKERIQKRFEQVRQWLTKAKPVDTEDHVFRLRALKEVNASSEDMQKATQDLLKLQQTDGGWAQTVDMNSDAYATGTALVALHEAGGVTTRDTAYRKGLNYLLSIQKGDGSWHVVTRSKPIQTYYESGYPHGKDQFISITAAAWATTALVLALPEKKEHWAWTPVKASAIPAVKYESWPRNAIDRFIMAKIETAGLKPAVPASREQLIRRVTFDLIGLPPTPMEVDAFVNDTSPQAWEKVIDRLLASPHYGERWGRHWLDLARYADSNGYEYDEVRPDAWRYRDYVIRAFNDDKPYDRFIREQLAGDELAPLDPASRVATGFNLLGPDMTDSSDQIQRRQNTLNDMTDTASLAFLGLTLGCARCHDHKFEPILQTDYYRMQAFFTPAAFRKDINIIPAPNRRALETAVAKFYVELLPVKEEYAKLEEPYRTKLLKAKLAKLPEEVREAHETPEEQRTPAQRERVQETQRLVNISQADVIKGMADAEKTRHKELQDQIKKIEAKRPKVPVAMGLEDTAGTPAKTFLLERGEPANKAQEVQPGYPVMLGDDAPAKLTTLKTSTGQRLTLANWVADAKNPLTARVMVNRLWHYHFGRGIVRTTSDFGVRGSPPTHPELLDWLAAEFVRNGWSMKHMHKLMLMSATYQQSTTGSKDDPDNTFFTRMNRQRLEGEIIRDSLLAVSGRLNSKLGGPGVFPPIPEEALKGSKGWTVSADKSEHTRRSIYIFARRNLRFPFLEAFDLPDSNLSCPKRERSTTAPQALALLNAADVVEAANALAAKLKAETKTDAERIALAYRLTLGRTPSAKELETATEFLKASPLSELCRALFNVNEFVYLD